VFPLRFPWVWAVLGWAMVVAVFAGSLMPGEAMDVVRVNDKLLHAGSYLVLMVWFVGLYRQRWHLPIALMLFLLGVGVEFLQSRLPTRHFDPMDMVANGAGIVIGLILGALWLTGWCQRAEKLLKA
jgi:VanZ family protein